MAYTEGPIERFAKGRNPWFRPRINLSTKFYFFLDFLFNSIIINLLAGVVKLVDAPDSKSGEA
jgi:hypothetical protein